MYSDPRGRLKDRRYEKCNWREPHAVRLRVGKGGALRGDAGGEVICRVAMQPHVALLCAHARTHARMPARHLQVVDAQGGFAVPLAARPPHRVAAA